jgi:hypothetical protein
LEDFFVGVQGTSTPGPDTRDQDDEEAERKREIGRPERHEVGPQAIFDSRVRKADLED